MDREINVEIIEANTDLAIKAMNNDWSFDKAKLYLDNAFEACSPQEDLGFYDIISNVFLNLQFKTKNGFQTKKVREEYAKLFEYLSAKFSYIRHFNVQRDNEEEALLMNDICVNCYNRMNELASIFVDVASRSYYWGIIVGVIAVNKIKKKFIYSIKSLATDSAFALRKYNTNNSQILENIRTFESEK